MANYSTLKAAVEAVVKTNGEQAITGANMQTVLLSIINSIGGGGYIFEGVATPSTNPGTPDQNVFYIGGAGTYANFGTSVIVPPTNIAVFKYNGSWTCEQVMVENGGVFDISAFKAVGGTLATYADLAAAIGTGGANVPKGVRKGGMSVKFVQSSDHNYVQFFCTADEFTTDVTKWQGVDENHKLGSDNLVKSGGFIDLDRTEQDLYEEAGQKTLSSIVTDRGLYGQDGYSGNDARYCCSPIILAGDYSFPAQENYQMVYVKYVSNTEGVNIYSSWNGSARNITKSQGDFVVSFRRTDRASMTSSDYQYLASFVYQYTRSTATLSEIRKKIGIKYEETYDISANNRLDVYWGNEKIKVGEKLSVILKSSTNSDLSSFRIIAYNNTTSLGDVGVALLGEPVIVTIPANATRLRFYTDGTFESASTIVVDMMDAESLECIFVEVDRLNEEVFPPQQQQAVFCNNIDSSVLVEMYFPNITSDWKITQVTAGNDSFRLNLKDANGVVQVGGFGNSTYSLNGKYSDLIHTFVNLTTCEVIGYFVLHYDGVGYSKSSSGGYAINVDVVKNINNSPRIKEYLSRTENLVLLGDSLFGYSYYNLLAPFLRKITNKKVFNAGCHGATMAWRFNGSDLDRLSYVTVCDSINSEDFSTMVAAASDQGAYAARVAELRIIDWTKQSTVIVCYCNNDITSDVPIGDLWDYTQQVSDFNKTTLLGAMNYGIGKLLTKYPLTRLIHTNQVWRYKTSNNVLVPPYAYTNGIGKTDEDYSEAIKDNAERLGVSFFDFLHFGGRNEYTRTSRMMDNSHFNLAGYEMCAKMIDAIDKGWMM